MAEEVELCGYLDVKVPSRVRRRVLSGWKAWNRKWLVIRRKKRHRGEKSEVEVKLFNSKECEDLSQQPVSSTPIHNDTVICRSKSRSRPFAFALLSSREPALFLAGRSESESQRWMSNIRGLLRPPAPDCTFNQAEDVGFPVSLIDNAYSGASGLAGAYGLLAVRTEDVAIHDPSTGDVKVSWDVKHLRRFYVAPADKPEDDSKICVIQTTGLCTAGPGEIYLFSDQATELVECLHSWVLEQSSTRQMHEVPLTPLLTPNDQMSRFLQDSVDSPLPRRRSQSTVELAATRGRFGMEIGSAPTPATSSRRRSLSETDIKCLAESAAVRRSFGILSVCGSASDVQSEWSEDAGNRDSGVRFSDALSLSAGSPDFLCYPMFRPRASSNAESCDSGVRVTIADDPANEAHEPSIGNVASSLVSAGCGLMSPPIGRDIKECVRDFVELRHRPCHGEEQMNDFGFEDDDDEDVLRSLNPRWDNNRASKMLINRRVSSASIASGVYEEIPDSVSEMLQHQLQDGSIEDCEDLRLGIMNVDVSQPPPLPPRKSTPQTPKHKDFFRFFGFGKHESQESSMEDVPTDSPVHNPYDNFSPGRTRKSSEPLPVERNDGYHSNRKNLERYLGVDELDGGLPDRTHSISCTSLRQQRGSSPTPDGSPKSPRALPKLLTKPGQALIRLLSRDLSPRRRPSSSGSLWEPSSLPVRCTEDSLDSQIHRSVTCTDFEMKGSREAARSRRAAACRSINVCSDPSTPGTPCIEVNGEVVLPASEDTSEVDVPLRSRSPSSRCTSASLESLRCSTTSPEGLETLDDVLSVADHIQHSTSLPKSPKICVKHWQEMERKGKVDGRAIENLEYVAKQELECEQHCLTGVSEEYEQDEYLPMSPGLGTRVNLERKFSCSDSADETLQDSTITDSAEYLSMDGGVCGEIVEYLPMGVCFDVDGDFDGKKETGVSQNGDSEFEEPEYLPMGTVRERVDNIQSSLANSTTLSGVQNKSSEPVQAVNTDVNLMGKGNRECSYLVLENMNRKYKLCPDSETKADSTCSGSNENGCNMFNEYNNDCKIIFINRDYADQEVREAVQECNKLRESLSSLDKIYEA